jgi:outer membrane protein assembly factor BamB
MASRPARIEREYGPFPDVPTVRGVTFDGSLTWVAAGGKLQSFDPETGAPGRVLAVAATAGTAFDGRHLFQIAGDQIQKIDPKTGKVVGTLPAPGGGKQDSGLTWAEGCLWVGQYQDRAVHQIDAETGKLLRTLTSDRFVTGVTWLEDELWHGTLENDESELRRVDATSGAVLERLTMPAGALVSGLESDGQDSFFCGGAQSGKVRRVRRSG